MTEPTPGFFNAENMDYLHKMVHEQERQIRDLQKRVNRMERSEMLALIRRIRDQEGMTLEEYARMLKVVYAMYRDEEE